ncbi:hypothetical protein [Peribacillus sp. NPDC097295]|uniref:hypothetical protein n=1 Tax=Peribacillus sp. NPDC097295 TaxID=3364402 RepID=UPI003812F7CA
MFVIYNKENNKVETVYYDSTNVPDEVKDKGVEVTNILPFPSPKQGINHIQMFDENKQEVYYLEETRDLTTEEKLLGLETQNNELKLDVIELASANETDKMETQLAIAELANIMTGGIE